MARIPEDLREAADELVADLNTMSDRSAQVSRVLKYLVAERRRSVLIAAERAAICADAVAKVKAGTLYAGIPTAFASENCARLEAEHIAALIQGTWVEPRERALTPAHAPIG